MPHLISAASLVAARNVQRFFNFTVLAPEEMHGSRELVGLKADDRCIAILIDYATNVHEVTELRPELRHWQEVLHTSSAHDKAGQIAQFLQKVIDKFGMVPQYTKQDELVSATFETPPQFQSRNVTYGLSKASLEAVRFLVNYYQIVSKNGNGNGSFSDQDRIKLAKVIESGLGLSQAAKALPLARYAKERMRCGQADVREVRKHFREIGVLMEHLPNYENREEEVKLI